ncbi:hypothetical protein D3C72_843960 [compost metagenome]
MASNKPRGGRPTIISDAIVKQIEQALLSGAFVETACDFAGISRETFYAWLKRGAAERNRRDALKKPIDKLKGKELEREIARRREEDPYLRFSDTVKKTQADAEVGLLAQIASHGKESWQANAWILERKFPDRYGVKRKVQVEIDAEVRKQHERALDRIEALVESGEIDATAYEKILTAIAELDDEGDGEGETTTP